MKQKSGYGTESRSTELDWGSSYPHHSVNANNDDGYTQSGQSSNQKTMNTIIPLFQKRHEDFESKYTKQRRVALVV
jgi:hypothetical protein